MIFYTNNQESNTVVPIPFRAIAGYETAELSGGYTHYVRVEPSAKQGRVMRIVSTHEGVLTSVDWEKVAAFLKSLGGATEDLADYADSTLLRAELKVVAAVSDPSPFTGYFMYTSDVGAPYAKDKGEDHGLYFMIKDPGADASVSVCITTGAY